MKTLLAWLARRQVCACGEWKLPLADACPDCTVATRPKDPPVIIAPAARKCR